MKIMLLGNNGMAGHMIQRYLNSLDIKLRTANKTTTQNGNDIYLDVEDNRHNIRKFINSWIIYEKYDYVINCIGLLLPDSIKQPDRAAMINSWWPRFLEKELEKTNTRIIHLSTDCVFDGKQGPYTELDTPTETNAYGKSKSLGEINNNKDITFRTSIIGPELKTNGTGLFNFVQTTQQSVITGWTNHYWNGITTLELAKQIHKWMQNPYHTGLCHLTSNSVTTSKYNLVKQINDTFNFGKKVSMGEGLSLSNKILLNTADFQFDIPDYNTQLNELKTFYYTHERNRNLDE